MQSWFCRRLKWMGGTWQGREDKILLLNCSLRMTYPHVPPVLLLHAASTSQLGTGLPAMVLRRVLEWASTALCSSRCFVFNKWQRSSLQFTEPEERLALWVWGVNHSVLMSAVWIVPPHPSQLPLFLTGLGWRDKTSKIPQLLCIPEPTSPLLYPIKYFIFQEKFAVWCVVYPHHIQWLPCIPFYW